MEVGPAAERGAVQNRAISAAWPPFRQRIVKLQFVTIPGWTARRRPARVFAVTDPSRRFYNLCECGLGIITSHKSHCRFQRGASPSAQRLVGECATSMAEPLLLESNRVYLVSYQMP